MDILQNALGCYQNSNYEEALNLLRLCEPSPLVDKIHQQCVRGLSSQYQYLITEAEKTNNQNVIHKTVQKYQQYIGQDDFIVRYISVSQNSYQKQSSYQEQISCNTYNEQEIIFNNNGDGNSIVSQLDSLLLPNTKLILVGFPIIVILGAIAGTVFGKICESYMAYALCIVGIGVLGVLGNSAINYITIRGCNTDIDTLNMCMLCYGGAIIFSVFSWYFTFVPSDNDYFLVIAGLGNPVFFVISYYLAYNNGANEEFKTRVIPWAMAPSIVSIVLQLFVMCALAEMIESLEFYTICIGLLGIANVVTSIIFVVKLYKNANLIYE